jgi:Mg2+/Co2+ transporter CorB
MLELILRTDNLIMIGMVAVLLYLSSFFSGSETALTAASKARIHNLEKNGDKRAIIVAKLLNSRERLLGGILLGIILLTF